MSEGTNKMKRIVLLFLLVTVMIITLTVCSESKNTNNSSGGDTVEEALEDYAAAFGDIDYKTFSGEEVLPFMTEEAGERWLDILAPRYKDLYTKYKLVREFTNVEISGIQVQDKTASAVIVINSIQKSPDVKECKSVPEKVFLKRMNGKWLIDDIRKQ